ncbi:MAG TPA: P-loop NTPase [Verrucomicrobiales bacterium]|nr:P-loop NTPase [Verrucomicrobiales bacterium]
MKTIVFWSYKGGVGKSLAAANFATCLSRLGIDCALLDLDIESPSLHLKLRSARYSAGRGGFVDYFINNLETDPPDTVRIKSIRRKKDTLPLAHYVDTDVSQPLAQPHLRGKIHFLPAGNYYTEAYWNALVSPLYISLWSVFLQHNKEKLHTRAFVELIYQLLSVKEEISKLQSPPRYLIVDLRSGFLQQAVTLINLWADCVGIFFANNPENTLYLSSFLPMISRAGHAESCREAIRGLKKDESNAMRAAKFDFDWLERQIADASEPKLIPVLSRFPVGETPVADIKPIASYCKTKLEDLSILHSDRELEAFESIHLGFHTPEPIVSRLTYEYLELFAKFLHPQDLPKEGLATHLGLRAHLNLFPRQFTLNVDTGALYNKDGARNVSFKVETFQLLLQGLREQLIQNLTLDQFTTCLAEAGYGCGGKFGLALDTMWREEESQFDRERPSASSQIERKINDWCKFDSDVGFGAFALETLSLHKNLFVDAVILLKDSFLTPAGDLEAIKIEDDRFCQLMTGYVNGVLDQILGMKVEVRHQLRGLHTVSRTSAFYVTVPKTTRSSEKTSRSIKTRKGTKPRKPNR